MRGRLGRRLGSGNSATPNAPHQRAALCSDDPTTAGDLLHDHVRVEERELFEEIERIVPAAELEGVRL